MDFPRSIGGYSLETRLARGGMGDVWVASKASDARRFAVKTLKANADMPQRSVRKFLDEAAIGASLEHPNIVRVFDSGIEDGHVYLVMELLDGATLAELRPLPCSPSAVGFIEAIALQVLDALAYLHQGLQDGDHGPAIVHRDLKPSNLFVTRFGEVKVLDFGIAFTSNLDLTHSTTLRGTVRYMPPETIRHETVDGRSDLFSLGVVLHELFTGQRLFPQESEAAVLSSILFSPISPVHFLRTDVPVALGELIARVLEREPDKRIASALELKEALCNIVPASEIWKSSQISAEVLQHQGTKPRPPTPTASPDLGSHGLLSEDAVSAIASSSAPHARADLSTLSTSNPEADTVVAKAAKEHFEDLVASHEPKSTEAASLTEKGLESSQAGERGRASSVRSSPATNGSTRERRRIVQGIIATAVVVASLSVSVAFLGRASNPTDELAPEGASRMHSKTSGRDRVSEASPPEQQAAPPAMQPLSVASPSGRSTPRMAQETGDSPTVRGEENPSERSPASRLPSGDDDAPAPTEPQPPTTRKNRQSQSAPRTPRGTPGWITVDARPNWARILIDGQEVGPTPIYRMAIKAGKHKIEGIATSGARQTRIVRVSPDNELVLMLKW